MKRAVVLFFLIASLLSSAYLLPDFVQTESAISLKIPGTLAGWHCQEIPETKEERATLAPDTEFSKAGCVREKPGKRSFFQTDVPIQRADISIVLSGHDLANSIHRPERCMPAQGHQIHSSEKQSVEVAGHGVFPARRLLSTKERVEAGQKITYDFATYYFFVGHDRITEDHTRRTLFDISDRLFKGQAQRWAYVSVSTGYRGSQTTAAGDLPDLDEADTALRELMSDLVAGNVDWQQIAGEAP
jgi:hypothetical protein